MDDLLLISRLILAAIFIVAGITKLTNRQGTVQAVTDFGLPVWAISPIALLLPIAELAVGIAFIPQTTAWWGAVGALALLIMFIAGIAVNLAQGKNPDCNCFGQIHSTPIGWKTIVRNAVFAVIAGFIIAQGRENAGPSLITRLEAMNASQLLMLFGGIAIFGFLIAEGWLLLHLFRQNGRLMLRMDSLEQALTNGGMMLSMPAELPHNGLAMDSPAPTFELPDLDGKMVSLDSLRKGKKPLMLIFSDPGCGPCNALLPEIARWQKEYDRKLTIALVSRGTVEDNRSKAEDHKISRILLQSDREVAQSYEAHGTPMAVIVKPDGTIGSSCVGGSEAISTLVATTVGAPIPKPVSNGNNGHHGQHIHQGGNGHHAHPAPPPVPQGIKIGEPAPQFELPDLDGKTVSLANFKNSKAVILFWNPGCGFCTRMIDDIKVWEANQPKGAPKLLVISTGTVEATKAHGFNSTVLIDQGSTVSSLFGAGGTPSGVLISEDGKVASGVAVGAQGVLALAGAEQSESALAG